VLLSGAGGGGGTRGQHGRIQGRSRPQLQSTKGTPTSRNACGGRAVTSDEAHGRDIDGRQRGTPVSPRPNAPVTPTRTCQVTKTLDHPDDPSVSVWSRLDRRPIQREQARSVWSRPDRRRAPAYGSGDEYLVWCGKPANRRPEPRSVGPASSARACGGRPRRQQGLPRAAAPSGSCGHGPRRPSQWLGAAGLPNRSGPVGFRSRGTRGTGCRPVRGGAASGEVGVCIARAWPSRPPWL
jgi:hypothetical protein